VRAEILFDFGPPTPAATPPGSAPVPKDATKPGDGAADRKPGIIEARGWISQARMGRVLSGPIEDDERLKQIVSRELNLQRRLAPLPGPAAGGSPDSLTVPEGAPVASEANSWPLYEDPRGRFHFRHPQELTFNKILANELHLVYPRPDRGSDVLVII